MAKLINKKAFNALKKKYSEWSGFTLESENLEDIKDEIKSKKWALECEVSEYANSLERLFVKCFDEDE